MIGVRVAPAVIDTIAELPSGVTELPTARSRHPEVRALTDDAAGWIDDASSSSAQSSMMHLRLPMYTSLATASCRHAGLTSFAGESSDDLAGIT